MKNLVMCAAYGYSAEDLKPFAHSLRKYYADDVLFLIKEQTPDLETLFNTYNIRSVVIEQLPANNDIQWKRYSIFRSILESYDVDRVFISDVRDVVFQDNPFNLTDTNFDLEFFEEPEKIRNCKCNAGWIMSLYGPGELTNIGDNNIICSGTTRGSKQGMLKYFCLLYTSDAADTNRYIQIKGGEDQPIHNYLIRNGKFESYIVYGNCNNAVATLDHQKDFVFDDNNKLIDNLKRVIPVVHQWDRVKQFSDQFYRIAME